MLPVIEPDGRRTGRQAVAYAAALVPVSLVPTFVGVSGTGLLRRRARAGRGAARGWPSASRRRAPIDRARAAVLRVDHLPAAHLDRDDRRQAVTVHDLPAVNATLNAISGVLLVVGYLLIRRRPIEHAPPRA